MAYNLNSGKYHSTMYKSICITDSAAGLEKLRQKAMAKSRQSLYSYLTRALVLQSGTGKTRNEEMGNGKPEMGNEETEIGNGVVSH